MKKLKILAFAAAKGRIGTVFLHGNTLIDWRISDRAAETPEAATAFAKGLFADFTPDVVITEELLMARNKGKRTLDLIEAIADAAEAAQLMSITLPRRHDHPNKYAEAEALVTMFPELTPWLPPPRRFYDNEPRNTVLFEALSLALQLREKDRTER
jgi:hypothetical protein